MVRFFVPRREEEEAPKNMPGGDLKTRFCAVRGNGLRAREKKKKTARSARELFLVEFEH